MKGTGAVAAEFIGTFFLCFAGIAAKACAMIFPASVYQHLILEKK